MMHPFPEVADVRRRPRCRVALRAKLAIAVASLSLAMLAFLLGGIGPHSERSFVARSEPLITRGAAALRAMAHAHGTESQEVLVELIRHSADARTRALEDIPLALYGGNTERIRAAIEEQDSARAMRLLSNVDVLGRELERRAARSIERHAVALTAEQAEMTAAFGSDLRRSHVLLTGATLAALVVLLGFGLDRSIIRPVHQLREATRRVASGDLAVCIDGRAGDEIGDLAGDFAAMVAQLRASRDEIEVKNEQLERWNRTLQEEVERKSRQLLHADKLASLGTLAGGVAHEFNNLIGGIRGCIADALGQEGPAWQEPLEVALRATQRATEVTNKLLRFARPRLEGLRASRLDELVGEVVDLVEPQARRQGVELETRIPPDLTAVVNEGEIHQVFLNLFTNALQAMPEGGRLTIDGARAGSTVRIRVADTGAGIPASDLDHVFDPFFTTRAGASDLGSRGSGLGLSVSYGIVVSHGGTLLVESTPGSGATFTVELPAGSGGGRA
jgi:two-component system NtrC family sensor kinase